MCEEVFYIAFGGMLLFTWGHQTYVNSRMANPVAPPVEMQNPQIAVYEADAIRRQMIMLDYLAKHPEAGVGVAGIKGKSK